MPKLGPRRRKPPTRSLRRPTSPRLNCSASGFFHERSSTRGPARKFLRGSWTGGKRIQGLQGGARAFVLSLDGRAGSSGRLLIVVYGRAARPKIFTTISSFFLGEEPATAAVLASRLHLFPSWEVLPFENLSPHPENIAGRLEGLYKLVEESAPILIATPAALMQRVIPKGNAQAILSLSRRRPGSGARYVARTFRSSGDFKMCRWSKSAATLACAAASSIYFRPATAGRCGSNSTAIDWIRSASSIRRPNEPSGFRKKWCCCR